MRMYPAVAAAGRRLQAEQAVADGEIVAVDSEGRPSFQALQHRGTHPDHTIVFYAFDLLHLNGQNMTSMPLTARRTKLALVIEKSGFAQVTHFYDVDVEGLVGKHFLIE